MSRPYPRLGGIEKRTKRRSTGARCVVCGKYGANRKVTIQVNWFRGDDEIVNVHQECRLGKSMAELLEAKEERRRSDDDILARKSVP